MGSRRKPVTIEGRKAGKGTTGLPALPQDLLAELQKDATDAAANVKMFGDSNLISIKGGVFSFKGENLGRELECVILASANMNELYKDVYDPNAKGKTPDCYALSETGKDMAPHAAAPDKQSASCDDCWAAKIGTASVGKGRACKQKVRIMLLHANDVTDAEAVAEALIAQVNVPAMSVGNYGKYVKVLASDAANKMPAYACITRITLEPHPTYQCEMKFSVLSGLADAPTLRAIMLRVRSEAKERVLAPYQAKKEEETRGTKTKKALPKSSAPAKVESSRGGKSRFSR